MRGRPLNIATIGRAVGFVAVAAAIVAIALHFHRNDEAGACARRARRPIRAIRSRRELARCQAIGMAAQDDAACEAAWAENRRRFFTYRPAASAASATPADQTPSAKPEDQ